MSEIPIKIGALKPPPKNRVMVGVGRVLDRLSREKPVDLAELPSVAPKIELKSPLDEGRLVGEVLLAGEDPSSHESKRAAELTGAAKTNWHERLGASAGESKSVLKQTRSQIESFGTKFDKDDEIERAGAPEEKRYKDALKVTEDIQKVLEGNRVLADENDPLFLDVRSAILARGGLLAEQLQRFSADPDKQVAMVQRLMVSGEYRDSLREKVEGFSAEVSPDDLAEAHVKSQEADDVIKRRKSEVIALNKKIKTIDDKLKEYQAPAEGVEPNEKYTRLSAAQSEVDTIQAGLENLEDELLALRVELGDKLLGQLTSYKAKDVYNSLSDEVRGRVDHFDELNTTYDADKLKLEIKKGRLEKLSKPKQDLEAKLEEARTEMENKKAQQKEAEKAKEKADRKITKAKNRKIEAEEEFTEQLRETFAEAVSVYQQKRVDAYGAEIDNVLTTEALKQKDAVKRAQVEYLKQRWSRDVRVEVKKGDSSHISVENRPKEEQIADDFDILTDPTDLNNGAKKLALKILETSPQFQKQSVDASGNPVVDAQGKPVMEFDTSKQAEFDALINDKEFMDSFRVDAVKALLGQRLRTEGILPSGMVEYIQSEWGKDLYDSRVSDPKVKEAMDRFGLTAEYGSSDFNTQLENLLRNEQEIPDPTDPEKDPKKKRRIPLGGAAMGLLLGLIGAPYLLSIVNNDQSGGHQ